MFATERIDRPDSTFVIFLREGIEASMIVAILLAYLVRINKRQHFRDVWIGVRRGVRLVLGGGVAAYFLIKQYEGSNVQTYFETRRSHGPPY